MDFSALKAEADALWAKRKFSEAAALCERFLESVPDDHQTLYGLGSALALQKRFAEAIPILERITVSEPGFEEVRPGHFLIDLTPLQVANRRLLARICAILGREDAAVEHLMVIRHYILDDYRIQYLRGRCLLKLGEWRLAIFALSAALKAKPISVVASAYLGLAFVRNGRWANAMGHIQRGEAFFRSRSEWADTYKEYLARKRTRNTRSGREAVAVGAPSLSAEQSTFESRIRSLWAERDFARVERLCRVFLKEEPGYPGALTALGAALALQRRFAEAVEPLSLAADGPKNFDSLRLLARVLARLGRNAEAAQYFQRGGAGMRDDYRTQYRLGCCLLKADETRLAIFAFTRAVALAPESNVASAYLALAFVRNGTPRKALMHLDRAGTLIRWWPELEEIHELLDTRGSGDEANANIVLQTGAAEEMGHDVAKIKAKLEGLWRERRYAAAERACRIFLQGAPDSPVVLFAYGAALAFQRRFAEAVAPLARAIEASPAVPEYQRLLARVYDNLGRPMDAASQLQAIQASLRNDFRMQYLLGRCLLKGGENRLATFALTRAISLNPRSEAASIHLGVVFFRAGRWRNAVDAFRRGDPLVRSWPEMAGAYAESLLRLRRFSEADECFLAGLRQDPDSVDMALGRAECLIGLKASEAALAQLNQLSERGIASARLYYLLGVAHNEFGHGNAGAAELEMAADLLEGDQDQLNESDRRKLFVLLGEIAVQDGRYEDARNRLLQALELAPGNAQILFLLALAQYRLGAAEDAAQSIAASIEASAMRPDPDAFVLLGMARMAAGDYASAEVALKRAVELSPFNAGGFLALGRIYMERGDWEEAEKALVRVKKVAPSTPELPGLLGKLSECLGREINMDSDVADIGSFEIPEAFRPPMELYLDPPPLGKALSVHFRVVRALMVREMLTRFGKSSLGYLWALLQPLLVLTTLYFVFRFTGRRVPAGVTLETLLLTGVVPIYLFIQTKSRLTRAIQSNRSLFYFRQVTPLSVLISRAFLEFSTYLVIFFVIYAGLNFVGQRVEIESYVGVILCMGIMSLLGFGLGSVFGILMVRFNFLEHVSTVVNRIIFLTSGMFFYGNELPQRLRDILLVNPIFHVVEFLRGAFFTAYTPHYASAVYVALWVGMLLLAGLALERFGRRLAA